MNSNRMKYASTPTYGMQKRNFAKKQAAAAQTNPTPDFTQQPAVDPNTPLAPFSAQNPYLMPPGLFTGAQPNAMPYLNNAAGMPAQGMMPQAPGGALQPSFTQGAAPGAYPGYMQGQPVSSAPPFQPQMGAMPASGGQPSFTARSQGYVPNAFPQGNNAIPPNVMRGDAFSGASMPPSGLQAGYGGFPSGAANAAGLNAPAGMGAMNGMGGMNGYSPASFPGGGVPVGQPGYGMSGYSGGMGSPAMPMGVNGGRAPFGGMEGGGMPAMPTPRQPFDMDRFLKILLYGVLPVLFIPCIFVSPTFDFLRYLFIILSVVTLSVLWYRQSFSSGLRTAVSVAYLALCIIVIALLISGNKDVTQSGSALSRNAAGQASAEPSVSPEAAPLAAQETPSPVEDPGESEAELRLSTFMDYWSVNRVEDMVNLVMPSWAIAQESPAQALFTVISNRTPTEYEIESISGTSTDSSRTITMSAFIDKNNGKEPVRYRFMILMVKESGEWYVDPNSLATNDTVEATETPVAGKETISQSLAPRMTVTPIPDASTKLYYNANGGSYYHLDPNCSAVNPKYLPMASFLYSELDDPPYSSLLPCLKCGAPTQSLKALEASATATPTAAP
ncbi:MAG: hypothetical protein GX418_14455 [Clostridiales bacterium]|nr:hypothetical protein [Clostridiales bacterium]